MIGADPDRTRELQALAIASLAAVIAYASALAGVFVYDDVHSIAANPGIQTLANLGRFFVDPTLFSGQGGAMYRPVLLVTFAVDWCLGGGAPLQFKLTNVLLHAATSALLLRLLRAHGARLPAALAAAVVFAVHPLASETINLASARSEALLVFGILLAMLGHLARLQGRRSGLVGMVLGCAIACGSKETGVVVPALLLVQEWLRGDGNLRRQWRAAAVRLLPVVLLVIVYLCARRWLLGMATATLLGRTGSDPTVGATRDLATQLATMGALLPRVLWRTIVPSGLSIDQPVVFVRSLLAPAALSGWVLLAAATWCGCRRGRQRPLQLLGVALAWAVSLPWVVIPLNVPFAEHRLYGALCGIACVLTSALDRTLPLRLPLSRAAPARWRRGAMVAGALVLVLFAAQSSLRSLDFRDAAQLWRAALAVHPDSFRARWGLGTTLQVRGDFAGAEVELARACALQPQFRAARCNWVETMLQLPSTGGWPFRALVVAEELTRQKDADPYYRLLHANALLAAGTVGSEPDRVRAAEARVLSCLEIAAPKALVYRLAAECRRRLGDPAGALAHLDAAIAARLDPPALRAERSEVLRELGHTAAAERDLRAAMQQAPMDPVVRAAWARRAAAPPR